MTLRRTSLALSVALAAGLQPAQPLLAQQKPAAERPAGPSITVIAATTAEIVRSVVVSGSMVARDEVQVAPEIDGLAITAVLAEEGDRVATGQVLAKLSRVSLDVQFAQNAAQIARAEAGASQARAQIAEAEANLVQTRAAYERTKTLRENGNASQELFDQRASAFRAGEARLNASREALAITSADLKLAEAQRQDIEVRLSRTEIKAARGGIISRRSAKLGAMAAMAATEPLFRIIADGAVELEAEVAEIELSKLEVGQPVAVTPAGAAQALRGRIRLIAPEVDKAARLGRLRIAIEGEAPVALGSFARGVIETGRREGVTLPLSAISYGRAGTTVQIVRDGKVATTRVTLGLVGGGKAEILSGVAAGDTVVARAGSFLRDGDVINPVATN